MMLVTGASRRVLPGQGEHLADPGRRRDGDRVGDHAALVLLDLAHLVGLLLDRQVLVQDAETALLGDGDRQPRLGDGVHRRRDQRDAEANLAGQLGGQADVPGQHAGVVREEQDVVERQGFFGDA
jgi:hypothetical protein